MTLQTSSAQPDMLFRYSEQAQEINRALSAEANWLGGRLARFESTCVESAFRVSIAGLDSSLRSHANQADAIDVGVRAVGQQFLDADRGLEILVQEATIVIEPPSPAIKKTGDIVDWIWEHLIKPLLGSDNETEDDKEELDNSKLGVSDSATITIPDPGGLSKLADPFLWLWRLFGGKSPQELESYYQATAASSYSGAANDNSKDSSVIGEIKDPLPDSPAKKFMNLVIAIIKAILGLSNKPETNDQSQSGKKGQQAGIYLGETDLAITSEAKQLIGWSSATTSALDALVRDSTRSLINPIQGDDWAALYDRRRELAKTLPLFQKRVAQEKEQIEQELQQLMTLDAELQTQRQNAESASKEWRNGVLLLSDDYEDVAKDYSEMIAQNQVRRRQLEEKIQSMNQSLGIFENEQQQIEKRLAEGIQAEKPDRPNGGFTIGQCTRHVADLRKVEWNGDAHQWDEAAADMGYAVGSVPVVGAIMVWESDKLGTESAGHVAYVTGVDYMGGNEYSVAISEANWAVGEGKRTLKVTIGSDGQIHDPKRPNGKAISFIYDKK